MNKLKLVITHPGVFHADEVMAVAYLLSLRPGTPVVRRQPTAAELEDPEVACVDVGGQFAPKLNNFDHHQKGGAGQRWYNDVKYASFGLVFENTETHTNPRVVEYISEKLVEPIDALDNGQKLNLDGLVEGLKRNASDIRDLTSLVDAGGTSFDSNRLGHAQEAKAVLKALEDNGQHIPTLSFSAIISSFNPIGSVVAAAYRDEAFFRAVALGTVVLGNFVEAAEANAQAYDIVHRAEATDHVLVLTAFVPWIEHVFSRPDQADILYVAFPSERGGYCIQQVPKSPGSFEGRKALPEAWAGLREQQLADLIGIKPGKSVFCHPGRFIGGAETLEDALKMAQLAIVEA